MMTFGGITMNTTTGILLAVLISCVQEYMCSIQKPFFGLASTTNTCT